eukprot:Em0019g1121a
MAFATDFPHKSDGEVDWHTLGNILTGELLGQVHCASFLDPLYGPKRQKTMLPETSWEYVGMKHKVTILKKVEGTSPNSFMGRGVVNWPVRNVAQLLADDMKQMCNWEKYLADVRCIAQLSEDKSDFIVYRCYHATVCLVNSKADLVYYSRVKYNDEKFVITGVSVSDTFSPPTPGTIRAKILPGSGYVLEPYLGDPNMTLVTYVAALTIGGVPAAAVSKVLKHLSVSVHYLNEYLKKSWGVKPGASEGLLTFDTTSDTCSECQPIHDDHLENVESRNYTDEQELERKTTAISLHCDNEDRGGAIQEVGDLHPAADLRLYNGGEVNWEALGQVATRCILEDVESIAMIDKKYGKGSRESHDKADWRFVHEKHDVVVYTKKQENSPIDCFLGRGIVNAPMRQVGDFTADIQSTFTWDNTLMDAKYVKVIKKSHTCTDYIGYQRHETTKCMVHAKRDNLYFVRCIYTNGKYVQAAISVDHSDCPPPPNTTRIKVFSGSGWVMEPYRGSETQTLVTYLAHVDLIGLPAIITNFVLKRHPLAIHYVKLHLPSSVQSLENMTTSSYHVENKQSKEDSEPIALLTDIDRRLEEGWRIIGLDA